MIRHRVLESSAGAEVVEVSAPAEHITMADHDLALPCPALPCQARTCRPTMISPVSGLCVMLLP